MPPAAERPAGLPRAAAARNASRLPFTPPLDWDALTAFLAVRAIGGVEEVHAGEYRRTVHIRHGRRVLHGWLAAAPAGRNTLAVNLAEGLHPARAEIEARLAALFDLTRDAAPIRRSLGPLAAAWPGLRLPGAFDGFETVVRAILGQQVTVRAASTLAARVAAAFGPRIVTPFPALEREFPAPRRLAAASNDELGRLGIVRSRIAAIQGLAQACAANRIRLAPGADPAAAMQALKAIHGIGEWTAQYAAMRTLKWSDAFPAADHGVLTALGVKKPGEARIMAERWRPWRAYAVMCLWHSAGDMSP